LDWHGFTSTCIEIFGWMLRVRKLGKMDKGSYRLSQLNVGVRLDRPHAKVNFLPTKALPVSSLRILNILLNDCFSKGLRASQAEYKPPER
jgi:hypothetical protein